MTRCNCLVTQCEAFTNSIIFIDTSSLAIPGLVTPHEAFTTTIIVIGVKFWLRRLRHLHAEVKYFGYAV
jgi:hypothetical protein